MDSTRLAIVGGSGIYAWDGLEELETRTVETPFGPPSAPLRLGRFAGERLVFLARHGLDHGLLPSEVNYRANVFALKSLGVEAILSVSAVGSLSEEIHPRSIVFVDQFIDRAPHRAATFFGDGLVAHVSMAEPTCGRLRGLLAEVAGQSGADFRDGGTYVGIEGPAFSTRAESHWYRSMGAHVIGMTNVHEAKLAREAEICYASLSCVTDYDCWHEEEQDVSVDGVLANLRANAETSLRLLRGVVEKLAGDRAPCACHEALAQSILTAPSAVPPATRRRLAPIVGKYLPEP